MSETGIEQAWLQQMVGEWNTTLTLDDAEPSSEPALTGTERVWTVGETWIVAENRSVGPDGSPSHTVTIIGYEPGKAAFTGGVAGTMAPVFFAYRGSLSADRRELRLDTEGPSLSGEKETDQYRDVFRSIDGDTREMIAQVRKDDGQWQDFMRTTFRRRSAA